MSRLGKNRAKSAAAPLPRRGRRKSGRGWLGAAGTFLGAAASVLAVYAFRSARERRLERETYARSGQAPSRTHIRLTSHPAAQGH